jgi:ribose transport system permease protein
MNAMVRSTSLIVGESILAFIRRSKILPADAAVVSGMLQSGAKETVYPKEPPPDAGVLKMNPDPNGSRPTRSAADMAIELLLVPWAGVLAALVVISVLLSFLTPYFWTMDNIFGTVALYFSWICIAGFGEGLVLIGGGLDLSVGSTMGLSGMVSALMLANAFPVWLAISAGLMVGAVAGLVNGALVTWVGLNPFIATLGTLGVMRGVSYGVVRGSTIALPDSSAASSFAYLGNGAIGVIPLPVFIMLIVGAILLVVMNNTAFGRRVYAIGGGEQASRLLGLQVNKIKIVLYVICGILAAVGGLLLTARAGTAMPDAGIGYELEVIAAVVIGGTSLSGGAGTIPGILIGAALLGVIDNGIVLLGIDGYWQQSITGFVIVLAAALDIARRRVQARKLR